MTTPPTPTPPQWIIRAASEIREYTIHGLGEQELIEIIARHAPPPDAGLIAACERLTAKLERSGEAWMSDPDWQFARAAIAAARKA